jgi:catechol 2,3-dioxygenase-like lactoylglutathione lyase family enzyme
MKIEHFAVNVEEPLEVADWYVRHLGFEIVKQESKPPYTTFLADDDGRVMVEIYNNPSDQVPDYSEMDPLIMHLALVSKEPAEDKKGLLEAGATEVSDDVLDDGSHLVMLRDPWGLAIQLCKRSNPMLRQG